MEKANTIAGFKKLRLNTIFISSIIVFFSTSADAQKNKIDILYSRYCIDCKAYRKYLKEIENPLPPRVSQKKEYKCGRKFNIPVNERLQLYPFNVATKIIVAKTAYRFPEDNTSPDSVAFKYIDAYDTLKLDEVNRLTDIFYNYASFNISKISSASKPYIPYVYVLFYKEGKLLEFISFNGGEYRTSSKEIYWGDFCDYSILENYFLKLFRLKEFGKKSIISEGKTIQPFLQNDK